jgi:Fic family protein
MNDHTQLDALKAKLDALRPIAAERLEAVVEKFRLDWTYHTNALEGNPLTLSETSFFIREGLTSKGKPLAAYLEVKNHIAALDYLDIVIRDKLAVNEGLMKQYHAMLFEKIDYMEVKVGADVRRIKIEPGAYKKENNHVIRLDGKIHEFADWLQVPGEIERLFLEFKENSPTLHPIELATRFHHKLVSIHPFVDGNGRVARLLMNTILMQAGYTPAIIPFEEKKKYLEALQSADDGVYEPLFGLVEELVDKSMRLMIEVVEGRDAFDFDDLARMVRNIAEQTRAIEQELGPASIPPEQRANQTALKIVEIVNRLLSQHAQQAGTTEIHVRVNLQAPNFASQRLHVLRGEFGSALNISELVVSGNKRFLPTLLVDFVPLFGRSRVALASFIRLGRFNENLQEIHDQNPSSKEMEGSIFLEDWDGNEISTFVLNTLKEAYQAWTTEMDRRKAIIAVQEIEVSKFRPRRE